MNLYLPTSNNYAHLLKPFSILFNKYWKNQSVTILCYDVPDIELPDNFKIISIGHQGSYWSNSLIDFFSSINDEYFILNCEDMFLIDYVDQVKINLLEDEIRNKRADRAGLHFYKEGTAIDLNNGFVEIKQNIEYRASIHPSIWRRDYLLKTLKHNQSLWEWETQKDTINDGAKIIFLKDCVYPQNPIPIFNTTNIYIKGKIEEKSFMLKPNPWNNGLIHIEDLKVLEMCR